MTFAKPIVLDAAAFDADFQYVAERIAVTDADACWVWIGSMHSTGYGVAHRYGEQFKAHRFAFELLVGPAPLDLHLDHLCRDRSCVNPAHLEPVTCLENIRRSPIHYGAREQCANGHEFTPENTRIRVGKGEGGRRCIKCRRKYIREYMRDRRAKERLRT